MHFVREMFVGLRITDVHIEASDRNQDAVADERFIGHAAHFFDHFAQYHVTEVRIGISFPGPEAEPCRCGETHHIVGRKRQRGLHALCDGRSTEERVAGADRITALVAQQVFDGDFADAGIFDVEEGRIVEDAFFAEYRLVERKFFLFPEFHDTRGGNQFRERGDPENVAYVYRSAFGAVCNTETFAV